MVTKTAPAATYEKGQLYQIPLADLLVDPNQPRKYMDPQALEDLVASIAQHGVLTPILFRRDADANTLFVVAGERRCEAAKKAGLTESPAILVEGQHAEIALVENLLRQDLTPVEEAEALNRLVKEQNYTQEQLGSIIGKARTTVSEILSLNRLPQEIRDACRADATVGRKTLIEIARKKQDRGMATAWAKYQDKQAKLAAGKQKRERAPAIPADVVEWVGKTNAKLTAIDPAAWTDEEKAALTEALAELKKILLALMKK
jgi:ParB family chromosome partitioning protein